MRMKTCDLDRAALNWLVAKCLTLGGHVGGYTVIDRVPYITSANGANWEDAPERVAHQQWIASIAANPRAMDERQRLHRGLIGPGSFLKTVIASVKPTVSSDNKPIATPRGKR